MNQNQLSNDDKWDVVILGGGIAGLTASIYLAKEGKTVLLVEKGSKLGGRGISNNVGGAQLNLGAHALYTNTLEILNEVGVNISGKTPKLSGSFVFGNKMEELKAIEVFNLFLGNHLKWKEKMEFLRFYRHIQKMSLEQLNEVSLEKFLNETIFNKKVIELILALVRVSTFTNNPELVSARVAISQLRSSKVLYVNNGWQSIVDDLVTNAIKHGVTIQKNLIISNIKGSYPNIEITTKDGNCFSTNCLLSTINPQNLVKIVENQCSESFIKKCSEFIPVRAACLDLVMNGLPNPKINFALGIENPWYFSNHSTVAKLSDKPGEIVVHVMKYLDSVNETEPLEDELELEGFLDYIQPGWRNFVVSRRFLPKLTVSNAIKRPLNNQDLKPNYEEVGIDGIYVAGDWVGNTEILLNASLISAKNATNYINQKFALQYI
ncbi:NAD(P)/FAD-dependent oxidoreductase [Bacillus sp. EAC]|uniref:NAD(P)/FAD-dependent oxidoreductase n=1 Tax=Bacillus sp. EAC TaxID=1978338 RepID=UPI000B448455|nr:NAD(P)/FAD-dependent oxidoreductase [Bacillus sp. EAC]